MRNLIDSARGLTLCLQKPTVGEGTNSATLLTTAAVDFLIDGRLYEKAITDNIAITACAQQATLTTCLYLVTIDTAGTVTTTKGREILTADLTAGNDVLEWPACPSGECPIGAFRIVAASGYTYTAGTTDNGATGITDTYYEVCAVPAEPMTS